MILLFINKELILLNGSARGYIMINDAFFNIFLKIQKNKFIVFSKLNHGYGFYNLKNKILNFNNQLTIWNKSDTKPIPWWRQVMVSLVIGVSLSYLMHDGWMVWTAQPSWVSSSCVMKSITQTSITPHTPHLMHVNCITNAPIRALQPIRWV